MGNIWKWLFSNAAWDIPFEIARMLVVSGDNKGWAVSVAAWGVLAFAVLGMGCSVRWLVRALPTIWDHLKWLYRVPQQIADRRAVAANPGNGWRVARLILNTQTPEQAEALFHDFMASPHKDQQEQVFATYWVQTCKLRGVTERDCWQEVSFAAVEHERKIGDARFWERTIPEVGKICRRVYGGLGKGGDDEAPGQ